jgi:hypothetical protein
MSWKERMALAYQIGLEHGKRRYPYPYSANGFDACYWQGYGHGSQSCACPDSLAGDRTKPWFPKRCVVCGQVRDSRPASP